MEADQGPGLLRVLLLGRDGQVGHELRRSLAGLGELTSLARHDADFSRPDTLRSIVRRYHPQLIVNAAAYTAVDKAESERDLAHAVNCVAPGVLAEEAHALGACIVHYSSDYVFDGCKASGYEERDATNPLSAYGRSKLAGEWAVASACRRHLILRTSWVYGAHGSNFLKTILRLAAERQSLRVVADQIGAPTSAAEIADMTTVVSHAMASAAASDARWGLYHLAAAGETSWHGYASHIVRKAHEHGVPLRAGPDDVIPITTADYPTAARRPASSRLCTAKLRATFGVDPKHWSEGVDHVLRILLGTRHS